MGKGAGIIQFARQYLGSHYLWGSAGSIPHEDTGEKRKPHEVLLQQVSLDPSKPSVYSAFCDQSGHHTCAGRFAKFDGGRIARSTDWDLNNYLGGLQNLKGEDYPAYYTKFYPRYVTGPTTLPPKIVWAEDCRGVMHFDCIGFVNFVLSCKTTQNFSGDIPQWGSGVLGGKEVTDRSKVEAGDVLIFGGSHIALATGDGFIVQAQDHANGIHDTEKYNSGRSDLTCIRRLPDAWMMA